MKPKYSGPENSGICICGHSWKEHHLGIVLKQSYIDATGEGYIPQECEFYGCNEDGGLKYNPETEEYQEHCFNYVDKGVK